MELAHVVYRVSTDAELAARFRRDPERTLDKLGLKLTPDERASLVSVLRNKLHPDVLYPREDSVTALTKWF